MADEAAGPAGDHYQVDLLDGPRSRHLNVVLDAGASVARLKEAIAERLQQESPLEYEFLAVDSGRLRPHSRP